MGPILVLTTWLHIIFIVSPLWCDKGPQVNKSHGAAELKLDISSSDYLSLSRLVPAGDTEFAQDAVFGYQSSNLREVRSCIKVGGR